MFRSIPLPKIMMELNFKKSAESDNLYSSCIEMALTDIPCDELDFAVSSDPTKATLRFKGPHEEIRSRLLSTIVEQSVFHNWPWFSMRLHRAKIPYATIDKAVRKLDRVKISAVGYLPSQPYWTPPPLTRNSYAQAPQWTPSPTDSRSGITTIEILGDLVTESAVGESAVTAASPVVEIPNFMTAPELRTLLQSLRARNDEPLHKGTLFNGVYVRVKEQPCPWALNIGLSSIANWTLPYSIFTHRVNENEDEQYLGSLANLTLANMYEALVHCESNGITAIRFMPDRM